MEEAVKSVLKTKIFKETGFSSSGCISSGSTFVTDVGEVFIKVNNRSKAREMFTGELASLKAIGATHTVRVPKPSCVVPFGSSSCALVMENVKMKSLNSQLQTVLGEQLARLHLHNSKLLEKQSGEESNVCKSSKMDDDNTLVPVQKFGFDVPTSCGYILQNNTWEDDWTTFYIRHKLQSQVDELMRTKGDSELQKAWSLCLNKVETILGKVKVTPSLLHGDLWLGNVNAADGEPIIFDAASFYGHFEYDMGIAKMFGGFSSHFYDAYHKLIPKTDGYDERLVIYELFHHLNHCLVDNGDNIIFCGMSLQESFWISLQRFFT